MYLIVRVHSSQAWADTPDYAVITLTADLCRMIISRITTIHGLTRQEGMTALSQMAYWDAHARYLYASALFPSGYGGKEDHTPLLTIDGDDAEEILDHEGMAVVPVLAAMAEDAWHTTDCHTLEVTTDAARWACVWGDQVRLTTWDVPVRLFEALADMEETTNASQEQPGDD